MLQLLDTNFFQKNIIGKLLQKMVFRSRFSCSRKVRLVVFIQPIPILLSTFQGARKRRDVQEYSGYNCDVSSAGDKSTFVGSHRIDLVIFKPKSTASLNSGRDRHDYPYRKYSGGVFDLAGRSRNSAKISALVAIQSSVRHHI